MNDQQNPAPTAPCGQKMSQEDFYRKHMKSLSAFFRRQGFSAADVEELAHDTFVRAFSAWGTTRCASWTWLSMVATNVWKNDLRRRHARKREAPVVELDPANEPRQASAAEHIIDGLTRDQQQRAAVTAIATLPPRMRQCLLLQTQHGLTMRAIAERLGITEGAVKAQIHEARERLKRQLGRNGPGRIGS